jgi:hypothetical protein
VGSAATGGASGGGLGAGGAIFVQEGGQLGLFNGSVSGGSVGGGAAGGNGGGAGAALGAGIFIQGTGMIILASGPAQNMLISDPIAEQSSGGLLIEGPGSVTLAAANLFSGGITLISGTLVLAVGGAAGSGGILFEGNAALVIGGFTPGNLVSGFAIGDSVDFQAIAPGLLVVTSGNGTTTIGGVVFSGSFGGGSASPAMLADDGSGGTLVTLACFAAGTRLLTDVGEVAVEALHVGDGLVGPGGRHRVVWIGRRRIDLSRHAMPALAAPIRVRADAFGPGEPHHDLWLSRDHAVALDGMLVPIHLLANGASIARDDVTDVTYFHVECARHTILLAEGLAVESYLDTGNRGDFEGQSVRALHPMFPVRTWQADGCAPLVTDGPVVAQWRARLAAREAALGWAMTEDPDLRVLVDGRELRAGRDGYKLPVGARTVRLLSRTLVPQEQAPESLDRRRLGVALSEVRFDDEPAAAAAFGAGFHDAEPGWRWTNGDASLAVPPRARRLTWARVAIGRYAVAAEARKPGSARTRQGPSPWTLAVKGR